MGPSINDVGNWEGGGDKIGQNWSKLPTDSSKKLPTWGRGMSKIPKKCRCHLWMVPMQISIMQLRKKLAAKVRHFF